MKLRTLLFFILLFYIWIAGPSTFNFGLDHGGSGGYVSYNHLAEALLAGKLHLLKDPDPRLLELPNPYDPSTNVHFRWHDTSLYKDKYYLYFGITPALVLYLPFKALTGGSMTDTLASIIFVFGSVIWGTLILIYIRNKYFPNTPKWMLLVSICVLGFGGAYPYIAKVECRLYAVAITSGCFFLTGGIYWLIKAFASPAPSTWRLLLGGFFLGLAVGGRPQHALSGIIVLLLVLFKILKSTNSLDRKKKTNVGFALVAPFSICLLLLGLYNYFRFDSFTEFGYFYQVGDINNMINNPLKIENISPNIYIKLFHYPRFDSVFPFFHCDAPFPSFIQLPDFYYNDIPPSMLGLLGGIPFLCLPFLGWFLTRLNSRVSLLTSICLPIFELSLLTIPSIIGLAIMLLFYGCQVRFLVDVQIFLILVSSIYWFYFASRLSYQLKRLLNFLAVIFVVLSSFIGISIGIDTMRRNRSSFKFVESLFRPLAKSFFKIHPTWEGMQYNISKLPVKLETNLSTLEIYNNADNAIDGDLYTHWEVKAEKTPSLTFITDDPAILKSIWLLSKHTTLFECWKKLEAKLYLKENLILRQTFIFPSASKVRFQHAELPPTKIDKIVLIFSEPVTTSLKGEYIEPSRLNPGYTEIVFEKAE